MVFFIAVLGMAAIIGLMVWAESKDWAETAKGLEKRKIEIRNDSMSYLRNHGGDPKGLDEFLFSTHHLLYSKIRIEKEQALDQYLRENPVIREPSYEEGRKRSL